MRQPKIPETSSDLRDLQLAALQSQLDDIKAELLGDAPMSVKWWLAGFRVVGSSGVRVFV